MYRWLVSEFEYPLYRQPTAVVPVDTYKPVRVALIEVMASKELTVRPGTTWLVKVIILFRLLDVRHSTDGANVTVGTRLGLTLGVTVGRTEGFTEGCTDGFTDGTTEGTTDGPTVGITVGLTEGVTVGFTVGVTEGTTLGMTDG